MLKLALLPPGLIGACGVLWVLSLAAGVWEPEKSSHLQRVDPGPRFELNSRCRQPTGLDPDSLPRPRLLSHLTSDDLTTNMTLDPPRRTPPCCLVHPCA